MGKRKGTGARTAAFLALLVMLSASCAYLGDSPTITGTFKGIRDGLRGNQDGLRGDRKKAEPRILRVLSVHGMGKHCIGHSETLINNLANQMGLREKALPGAHDKKPATLPLEISEECDPDPYERTEPLWEEQRDLCNTLGEACKVIEKPVPVLKQGKPGTEPFTYGFVRIRDYAKAGGDPRTVLRFFELTWDPTTRRAKKDYLGVGLDKEFERRMWVNRKLKDLVINQGFSDSALYLGKYRAQIFVPFYEAICWMMVEAPYEPRSDQGQKDGTGDNKQKDGRQEDGCNLDRIIELADNNVEQRQEYFDNEIVLIASSLGSRILYDAIVNLIYADEGEGETEAVNDRLLEVFLPRYKSLPDEEQDALRLRLQKTMYLFGKRLFGFYMLANQLQLLEMRDIVFPRQQVNDSIVRSDDGGVRERERLCEGCRKNNKVDLRAHATAKLNIIFTRENPSVVVRLEEKKEEKKQQIAILEKEIVVKAKKIAALKKEHRKVEEREAKIKRTIEVVESDQLIQDYKTQQVLKAFHAREPTDQLPAVTEEQKHFDYFRRMENIFAKNKKLENKHKHQESLLSVQNTRWIGLGNKKTTIEARIKGSVDEIQVKTSAVAARIEEIHDRNARGKNLAALAEKRKTDRFEVIAISDPNDLLSFTVPPSNILPKAGLINVTANIAKIGYLGIAANPIQAHTGHAEDDTIIRLMACGGKKNTDGAAGGVAACAEF